jgi:hypothetical protein
MVGILKNDAKEQFAQGLAYGFTPMSAAEHARLNLTSVEAAHLSADHEIRDRVQELVVNQQFDMSLEHIRIARQLEVDRDFAYQTGNPAAAINATVQRAKVLGVFVERTETNNKVAVSSTRELTPDEWAQKFGAKSEEKTHG